MRATRISGADEKPLGAPPDWSEETHGHCGALFVRREVVSGEPYMRSAWEVEASEALMQFAGARITLGIRGNAHPVVQLGISELPQEFEPVVCARRFNAPNGKESVRVEMLFPYAGGRRAYSEVTIGDSLGEAISHGVADIEKLARREGWIE